MIDGNEVDQCMRSIKEKEDSIHKIYISWPTTLGYSQSLQL